MATLIFRNTGVGALDVADLGIYLESNEELDLLLNFRDEDIVESQDIELAMSGDGEVWLNGTTQLTYNELIDYLTKLTRYDTIDFSYVSGEDSTTDVTGAELEALTDGSDTSLHNHDNRYYTETELQTSGNASVHWGNITNAPQFGNLHWKGPVDRTDSGYGSGTVLPTSGNAINDARMVRDDGDGKPAQYVCVATSGTWDQQWTKIADVDWGSANSIGVTPVGNLSSNDVQAALEELQGDIDTLNSGANDTLDEAYDGPGGSGSGRSIVVDSGAVVFDASSSTGAPVQLTQQASLPTTGLAAGQLSVVGGELYMYDSTRNKWLSVTTHHYQWSDVAAKGKIMRVGIALDSGVGYKIPWNATIVSVTVWNSDSGQTRGLQLRKNGTATSLKSFNLSAGAYTSTNDNIDVNSGDVLQVYVSGGSGGPLKDPVVSVYLKRR